MTQEFDWNLLAALDTLLAEGSVTAAAGQLHLSVPATSRTLSRIRQTFGDPMLVRAGRGLVPTPRAQELQQRLHRLVEEADAIVRAGRELDLAALQRTFTIRANDAIACLLAARLAARTAPAAPGVKLRFLPEGEEDLAALRDGEVDLDLGVIPGFGPEVRTMPLYEERLVGMVASDHPLDTRRVTLRRLAAVEHVAVSRRGRRRGPLDDLLEAQGLRRSVVAVVPTFTSAAHVIATSRLTGMLPERYAREVAGLTGARLYDVPAELPLLAMSQAWHVRNDLDPAHRWLRTEVAGALSG